MSDLIERLRQNWRDYGNPMIKESFDRIAELEAENSRLQAAESDFCMGYRMACDAETKVLNQEVARLTAHIRAIAEHHDGLKYSLLDGVRSLAWELHHTERRDFALSGLEGK